MSKFTSGSLPKAEDPVTIYLRARGVSARDLPPDMLRELTRLLASGQLSMDEVTPSEGLPPPLSHDAEHDHHHEMLTFEMYLAAWIAREGICDKPRS